MGPSRARPSQADYRTVLFEHLGPLPLDRLNTNKGAAQYASQ